MSNHDAERCVIAAILNDTDGSLTDSAINAGVTYGTFSDAVYATCYRASVRLRGQGLVPDVVSVCTELDRTGELDRCGGAMNVNSISNSHITVMLFGQHLERIIAAAAQRDAMLAATEAVQVLGTRFNTRKDLAEAIHGPMSRVERAIRQVSASRSFGDIVVDAEKALEERLSGGNEKRLITWGLRGCDRVFTRIEPHELVVIAARPSLGKSSLSRSIAWENAKAGKRVAVFLLETSDRSFIESCAAQDSKISLKQLRDYPRDRIEDYRRELGKIHKMDNIHLFDHDMTMDSIESRCRVLRSSYTVDLVVVDYLQIIRGRRDNISTADAIGELTSRFVSLVKHMGCPLILMSQLNREQERANNRVPQLSDLRDSGSIEADAHRIVFIHRTTLDRSGVSQLGDQFRNTYDCTLVQAKLRDGPKAQCPVVFHTDWATFEDGGSIIQIDDDDDDMKPY